MSSRELFEEYFDSSFKKGNILTEKQYEKAACEFKRFYDGVMPQDKGAVILDIGCGAGHFLYYLKKEGFENFLGIDISVRSVRNFLRKGLVRMLHSFIRFIYYIQDFTVPDNLDKNLVIVARKK